ncbi:MAG: asparagine synthetase B [Acidobacteria bacterium]|nr:MAG: asparagine synthetase B [Acidobacteriota bacterium]
MSGFVCILHRDGAPIERALLQFLTHFLSYRGPDARESWIDGSIGMGHALLRTTQESKSERQPASLEGRYWIVADARLDAREQLIAELRHAKREVRASASDCELILQAYAAWGTPCVDRLMGDFSFAVWDAGHKQLFCARDHFGIKPFYHAQRGDVFLFSNTLNCIRLHPHISGELNDAAIGDFLLFGLNYNNETTCFRNIQRLPPAHSLTASSRGLQIKRYWTPPTDGRIRYGSPEQHVENFQSILEKAVADRLRTDRVGILLSGGLDSSSVAAVAKEVAGRKARASKIRGYTYVYESLIPDREGDYAREVGEFLGIPIQFVAMDEAQLFERWDETELNSPEPLDNPFLAVISDTYRDISTECRVLFSGEGSDNLMDFQMWPYVGDLRRRGEWRRLLTEVGNYLWIRPFPWRGIRARVLRLVGKDPDRPVFPDWLAPEFSRRANLQDRWKEQTELPKSWAAHPIHPRGHGSLSLPQWTHLFEQEDPGTTGYPVETCYPFLDLRMVNYLLAIPPFPWFFSKTLLREAMAGRLPERVRTRPKTPLRTDPVLAQIRRAGNEPLKKIPLGADMDRYIDRSALMAPHAKMNQEQVSVNLRPYCLNIWLQSAQRIRYNMHAEASNG